MNQLQMLLQMIQNGSNPQQMMMNLLNHQMSQTPIGANLLKLAEQGNSAEIERIARNLCSSRGADFDTEFRAFKNQIGFK